jgi:hypothetical protein
VILLPPGWAKSMAPEELRCVLLHEIGHHRRADVFWRWMFLLARAVHWFNPLAWMAEREMRFDQEMACDEWVLARDADIDSQKYGEALLLACKNLTPSRIASPGHATMAESSAGLARRIRQIARMKTHGWSALAGTAALALALCVIGPAPGVAQNPTRVADETPTSPEPASAPASAPSSTPAPASAEKARDGSPGTSKSTGAPVSSAPAKAKEPLIEIETKFLERPRNALKELADALPGFARPDPVWVLEDPQWQVVFRALSRMKGANLVSAPRVTCKSGQRAISEMIKEVRYPTEYTVENDGTSRATPSAFETRNVGITIDIFPTIGADGRIDLQLIPSVVEFGGFVNYGVGRPRRETLKGDALTELMKNPPTGRQILQPIFNTRTISTSASIRSGQTVIVGGVEGFNGADTPVPIAEWKGLRPGGGGAPARAKKAAEDKTEKYLLIFVSARILNPEDVLPAAVPVPDKPGYVTSPYAPKAGFIDVRGFPAGTEMRCPYSGKYFVTP